MDTLKLTSSEKDTLTIRGYELISKIGEGAYAQVYLSSYKDSPYKLACKVVDVPKSSATYVNKFLPRELNILMAIKSQHIVHIHSIFRRNLKYFIFMRFAEKGDLMDWIISNGPVSQYQSKVWTKQIVSGMQYLHKNFIAHRDIKCENILITENSNIKLTDFGFSRYLTENDKIPFSETFCGSLLYVAPEIVKGVAYNPFKSDMWSLGVVIFTMLNCRVPFNESNPFLIYELQMGQKYRFKDNDASLADVKNLVKRLLQPDPKKRPNADAVLEHNWFTVKTVEDEKTEENSEEVKKMGEEHKKEPPQSSMENIMKTDVSLSDHDVKTNSETIKTKKKVYDVANGDEKVEDSQTVLQIISKSYINADDTLCDEDD